MVIAIGHRYCDRGFKVTHLRRILTAGLLAALAVGLAACGGGSSGPKDTTGRISLGISDGPVHDANKVCVAFNAIEFKGAGDSIVEVFDPVESINLLEFQGDNAAPLLFNYELPAGDYQWMRLGVNAVIGGNGGAGNDRMSSECQGVDSYIVMDSGSAHNLYVPSGAQSGLKLVGGFTVPAGGSANFTAEFDLMKSVTAPPGLDPDVVLRPTIRLVNNVEVGTLTGEITGDPAAAIVAPTEPACAPSVYVFADGVTPNPIGVDAVNDPDGALDPIATAAVNEQLNDLQETEYHYTVGFLLAGHYEVAFTCDGTTFDPANVKPAEIIARRLTEVNFP
jgi:hypothetical protein